MTTEKKVFVFIGALVLLFIGIPVVHIVSTQQEAHTEEVAKAEQFWKNVTSFVAVVSQEEANNAVNLGNSLQSSMGSRGVYQILIKTGITAEQIEVERQRLYRLADSWEKEREKK